MRFVALLRGVNVGGHRKLPMADLRALAEGLGFSGVRTYVQSGNLVFDAAGGAAKAAADLEAAVAARFGFTVPVVVRPATAWRGYVDSNPFPRASEREPNLVLLGLAKAPPPADAAAALAERAAAGERVELVGDALWFHFPQGSARSKLTPALLDRLAGSPVTTRNWRTVTKLAELAASAPPAAG